MNDRTIMSWSQARDAGLRKYFTGKPCKNGHIAELHISGACSECKKEGYQRWLLRNPGRANELHRNYVAASKEEYLKISQNYKNENRERCRETARAWKKQNPESRRMLAAKWRRANPGKVAASNLARKFRRTKATPLWADMDVIKQFYIRAAAAGMHVDHIIPLNGANVCGLHVENNLQLLTPMANAIKGNSFDDNQVDDLHMVRREIIKGGLVKVVITELDPK